MRYHITNTPRGPKELNLLVVHNRDDKVRGLLELLPLPYMYIMQAGLDDSYSHETLTNETTFRGLLTKSGVM